MKKHSIPTTREQRSDMINQIQTRRSVMVARVSSRKSIHLVELSPGEVVRVEYNRRYHRIVAVYSTWYFLDVYGGWAA